jgi:hypothetical protein
VIIVIVNRPSILLLNSVAMMPMYIPTAVRILTHTRLPRNPLPNRRTTLRVSRLIRLLALAANSRILARPIVVPTMGTRETDIHLTMPGPALAITPTPLVLPLHATLRPPMGAQRADPAGAIHVGEGETADMILVLALILAITLTMTNGPVQEGTMAAVNGGLRGKAIEGSDYPSTPFSSNKHFSYY